MLKYFYFPKISIAWCCVALVVICLILLVFKRLVQKGVLSKRKGYASAILVAYIIVLLVVTVFARTVRAEREYELRVFWTYRDIAKDGVSFLIWQILYNLLMLFPIGFLIPYIRGSGMENFKEILLVLRVGAMVSGVIEMCQLLLKRGMFEIDDIIHNLLGVILGYIIFRNYSRVRNRRRK